MKTTIKEKKELLNGDEVWSIEFEGCVYIEGDYYYVNGKKRKLNNRVINILYNELLKSYDFNYL